MDNNRWQPVSISKKMMDRVDTFLKTEEALSSGLTSRADVITMLLREFLNKVELQNNGHSNKSNNSDNNHGKVR